MFILDESFWEVKQTEKMGRGIFAKKDIKGGTVLGDYLGKIIAPEDEPDDATLYAMYYSDNATILPDPKDIGVHIINHSCMPNCESYTYQNHILYFALRKIFEGEELTINYNLGPADEECDPCTHTCLCNTPLCRGSQHTSEESIKIWQKMLKGNPDTVLNLAPPVPYGEQLGKLSAYPDHIEDNPYFDLFANINRQPVLSEENVIPSDKELRKRIRENGLPIFFKNVNSCICGVTYKLILSLPTSTFQ
jgi:hypothetical protein